MVVLKSLPVSDTLFPIPKSITAFIPPHSSSLASEECRGLLFQRYENESALHLLKQYIDIAHNEHQQHQQEEPNYVAWA